MSANVLIVDDEATILDLLEACLGCYNCRITRATDGDMAIEAINRTNFDLVITDLNMPGKDGLEVLKRAKARHPATLVFVITGCDELQTALKTFELGADEFLLKPFPLPLLLDRLKRHGFSCKPRPATRKNGALPRDTLSRSFTMWKEA